MQHCGVFSTTWKPLPVSHVFTVMSWIVAQPLLSVKVFYNWLVWCANLLTIPRLSAPPIGMAKLYQQKLSWTRLQISAKVCHLLFFFLSYQHCPLLSLLRFNMHERKLPRKIYSTYTFLKFSKNCSIQGVTSVIKKNQADM